jgi:hypothetical protein
LHQDENIVISPVKAKQHAKGVKHYIPGWLKLSTVSGVEEDLIQKEEMMQNTVTPRVEKMHLTGGRNTALQ